MIEKVKVLEGQNIVDLAIQHYGSVEGLIALARRNNLAVDEDPAIGTEIEIDTNEIVNEPTSTFFKKNNMTIATGRI